MSNTNKKSKIVGIIFWLFFVIIVTVLFITQKTKVANVMQETQFFEKITAKKEKTESLLPKKNNDSKNTEDSSFSIEESVSTFDLSSDSLNAEEAYKGMLDITPPENPSYEEELIADSGKPLTEVSGNENTKKINTSLYFIKVSKDGNVLRRESKRSIGFFDSPLTSTLNTLLTGPSEEEKNKGFITLIPAGSKLLSASIRDRVAYLNFSEDFQFNKFGVEGYLGQLMQVVYTATEFPTVDSVQFLIDGQIREYLGSEGAWIGNPLSRNNF